MNDRPLYGAAVYNPELLSKAELLRTFVARGPLLARLLDDLRREQAGTTPQHHLIMGRRGMGKSALLYRLRYAVEDDPALSAEWLALTFPEEQYNVAHLSDFWLNCIDALADHLERTGQRTHLARLDAETERIHRITDESRRQSEAQGLLLGLAGTLERRLILLIDNVDLVLDRLKKEEWSLREVLSVEPRLLLIGATANGLESSYNYGAAFYDFFKVHALRGLDDRETLAVVEALADTHNKPEVANLARKAPGRLSTLRLLSGGNPRTLTLLFNLWAQGIEGDVRSDLERLLDQCTPLYKHRFEDLPPQAQRVVDALALHWAPMTAGDAAQALNLEVNLVSAQLNTLVKRGEVEKVDLPGTRRTGFQISERFFNIWYLMRTSRRVRRRLVWLVEFLRLMYDQGSVAERGRHLVHRRLTDDVENQQAEALARRALEHTPGEPDATHTVAAILASQGRWAEAELHLHRLLDAPDDDLAESWSKVLALFTDLVRHHRAQEAHTLLAGHASAERWAPLVAALEVAAEGRRDSLGALAPEMRQAADLALAVIAPELGPHRDTPTSDVRPDAA